MGSQRTPRDGAPGTPARGMSAEYITAKLSPTAQRILAAAQRVLQRDGYSGVTLQRVAAEAGEHKSLVIYHFGNKATLMWMLVDSLWHDLDVELFQSVETLPQHSERRISALIDSQRRLGHLTTQQQMYLDLFPGLTRRGDTRRHLGELNRSYRDLHRRFLSATSLQEDELTALAGLVLAIGDGMAVSLLVRPVDIDDLSAYQLLEAMVLSLAGEARHGPGAAPAPAADAQRPPSQSRAPSGGSPVGPDPLHDLAPVARKLVRGARTVLRKRGFEALTLESVGREAGEPRSSITYYFGDKHGLITALIRTQFHEQRKVAARMLGPSGDGHDCTVGAICAARELLTDKPGFRTFYDLLPVVTRDPDFLSMQAAHDRWLSDLIAAGLRESGDPTVVARAELLAVLEIAAADGLAMQVLSDPSGFDPNPSCAMLERLINRHTPAVDQAARVDT
jgi:AcrR family transcriptional regulator